jgi:hypothetical protein
VPDGSWIVGLGIDSQVRTAHPAMSCSRIFWVVLGLWIFLGSFGLADPSSAAPPDWLQSLTTDKPPGDYSPLPALHAKYRFGWSGLSAASADVRFNLSGPNYSVDASGSTGGLARSLFPLDVTHHATGDRKTLRAAHVFQTEKYRSETVQTSVDFKDNEVTSLRKTNPQKSPPKSQSFDAAPAFDLMSALLWLRSQPLKNGDHETLVAYPSNSPYYTDVSVVGREKIRIGGVERDSIKVEVTLKSIDKQLRLKRYKKLKSARGWISDDELRIPLRIEADIFIGYVFAELESLGQ